MSTVAGSSGVGKVALSSGEFRNHNHRLKLLETHKAKPTGLDLDFWKSIEENEIPPEMTSGTPGAT